MEAARFVVFAFACEADDIVHECGGNIGDDADGADAATGDEGKDGSVIPREEEKVVAGKLAEAKKAIILGIYRLD